LKKTINGLFLLILVFVLIAMVVYNYYEQMRVKEKNTAQTQKARETKANKKETNETDTDQVIISN
jgi:CHASE3 domain sensor protein